MNTLNAGLKPKLLMALTLLREKSDEKKFVGLLLVAKILNTECLISCETIVESGASSDPSFISAASPSFASASAASPLPTAAPKSFEGSFPYSDSMDDSDDEEDGKGEGHHQTGLYEEKSATISTLPSSSVMDPAILTDIGDAVGADFLVRLLTTVHGDLASVSLQLGLDIIATLCDVPCLTKRFLSIESLILQRMLESPEAMRDAQQLESSSRILLAIATLHLEEAHEAKSTVAISDMDFELHCRWSIVLAKQLLIDKDDKRKLLFLRCIETTLYRFESRFDWSVSPSTIASQLIIPLCSLFASIQTALKFDLLRVLLWLLQRQTCISPPVSTTLSTSSTLTHIELPCWCLQLRHGVADLLYSRRIGDKQRRPALLLCAAMLHRADIGQCWATSTTSTTTTNKTVIDVETTSSAPNAPGSTRYCTGQFIQMMMKLVTIEIRVLLETNAIRSTAADSLIGCFQIVEDSIAFLTDNDSDEGDSAWSHLPGPVLLSMQQAYHEIFSAVIAYLKDARDDDRTADVIVIACIRVLCRWLAEDNEPALYDSWVDLLPYILRVTESPENDSISDHISYLVPFLTSSVATDDKVCSIVLESSAMERLQRVISYFEQHMMQVTGIYDLPCSYEWTEMSTILALYCSLLSSVTTRPNISYDTNNDSYGQPMAQLYPLVFAAELPNIWRLALDLARVSSFTGYYDHGSSLLLHTLALVVAIIRDTDTALWIDIGLSEAEIALFVSDGFWSSFATVLLKTPWATAPALLTEIVSSWSACFLSSSHSDALIAGLSTTAVLPALLSHVTDLTMKDTAGSTRRHISYDKDTTPQQRRSAPEEDYKADSVEDAEDDVDDIDSDGLVELLAGVLRLLKDLRSVFSRHGVALSCAETLMKQQLREWILTRSESFHQMSSSDSLSQLIQVVQVFVKS